MTDKTDFQARVLKKYGVIPLFDGPPAHANVKTSVPGETFNQWCVRVVGKKAKEVRVLSLVDTTPRRGNAHIGGLAGDAEHLQKIIRFESRKSHQAGMLKASLGGDSDVEKPMVLDMPKAVGRDLLYETMADAVLNRTPAVDEFFGQFADKYADESDWADLFEILARKYAELADWKRDQFGTPPE